MPTTTRRRTKMMKGTPAALPPPTSPDSSGSEETARMKNTPMHAYAEKGQVDEMMKLAEQDPALVACKGHMMVRLGISSLSFP